MKKGLLRNEIKGTIRLFCEVATFGLFGIPSLHELNGFLESVLMLVLPSLAIIGFAIYAILKGLDVRLGLLGAAFLMTSLNGDVTPIVREFLATFSNEKFVVPICSAMGFAYVLKHTDCDQHLVQLLVKPIRRARLFLIPGVVLIGFLVNIPVISQTSTAVCIGPVVVPLMLAAKISPITIGASLLLGASVGGELLNPGAPELNSVAEKLKESPAIVAQHLPILVFPQMILATSIFWILSIRAERRIIHNHSTNPVETEQESFRVNYLRALVPLVPIVLLFLTALPNSWFRIPQEWIVDAKSKSSYGIRLIAFAMMVGVLVAAVVNPRKSRGVGVAFFDGAGYAFTTIISLIVTASCFGKALEEVGMAREIGKLIGEMPSLLHPISSILPWAFGVLSGSGMAATQSLYELYIEPSRSLGADPMDVGAMVSVSAAAGRTMSPFAAVALMSAKLTGTDSFTLAHRVALPLMLSLGVVLALRMIGLL